MNWARVYRTPQLELGQSLQDTLVRTLLRILVRFYITGNPIWNLKFHPLLNSNSEPGNMNDMPMHMKTMCRQHQTRSQPVPSQPPATIPTITSMSAQHRFYARNVIKYLFINRILAIVIWVYSQQLKQKNLNQHQRIFDTLMFTSYAN